MHYDFFCQLNNINDINIRILLTFMIIFVTFFLHSRLNCKNMFYENLFSCELNNEINSRIWIHLFSLIIAVFACFWPDARINLGGWKVINQNYLQFQNVVFTKVKIKSIHFTFQIWAFSNSFLLLKEISTV